MKTRHDPEFLNPPWELWLPADPPVFLMRFFDFRQRLVHIPNRGPEWAKIELEPIPISEHVYKPSGMYDYRKGSGTAFHYEYAQTRKV